MKTQLPISMNQKFPSLSIVILTYNEEKHIGRCISSLQPLAKEIFIVDSFSTDDTVRIAQSHGANVVQNPWTNHAVQLNWALDNLPISTRWVMRMDADEYLTPELAQEIIKNLDRLPMNVNGVYVKRKVFFMGRWIRHGGYYPTFLLRLWRTGMGRSEQRWMDEHIMLSSGETMTFEHDIVDENLNDLTWWTDKHNRYATREAADLLNTKYKLVQYAGMDASTRETQDKKKRWIKENIYSRIPAGIRALIYFLHRYFLRLGFLDGYRGTLFHLLQGFWYRLLVDAKIYEIERKSQNTGRSIKQVLIEDYGIDVCAR